MTADPLAGGVEPGLSERALLAAEATGDPDAVFLALQARHADLIDPGGAHERLAAGERAVQLDGGLGERGRGVGIQVRAGRPAALRGRLGVINDFLVVADVLGCSYPRGNTP